MTDHEASWPINCKYCKSQYGINTNTLPLVNMWFYRHPFIYPLQKLVCCVVHSSNINYCVVCCVYCELCSVQCLVCSVQYVVCSLYFVIFSWQCVVCSVQCVVFSVQCILCSVQCIICSVQCVWCIVQYSDHDSPVRGCFPPIHGHMTLQYGALQTSKLQCLGDLQIFVHSVRQGQQKEQFFFNAN